MNLIAIFLVSCLLATVQASRMPVHIRVRPHAHHHGGESVGHVVHKPISFGPLDHFLGPIKIMLQETTVTTCTLTKLCNHELLNEEPFVKLLGPYEPRPHGSHGIFGLFEKLNPISFVKSAIERVTATFAGEVVTMEENFLLAPFKPFLDIFNQFG